MVRRRCADQLARVAAVDSGSRGNHWQRAGLRVDFDRETTAERHELFPGFTRRGRSARLALRYAMLHRSGNHG